MSCHHIFAEFSVLFPISCNIMNSKFDNCHFRKYSIHFIITGKYAFLQQSTTEAPFPPSQSE